MFEAKLRVVISNIPAMFCYICLFPAEVTGTKRFCAIWSVIIYIIIRISHTPNDILTSVNLIIHLHNRVFTNFE